ncbi:MAG: hypothetical protein B6D63_04345 [Candidatus Latescibacteria bacterium 4484_7]|nr:MAG: hypothetical protein B6D63_04345 [Candidatus Latescibacteria bacterium 4484_7]
MTGSGGRIHRWISTGLTKKPAGIIFALAKIRWLSGERKNRFGLYIEKGWCKVTTTKSDQKSKERKRNKRKKAKLVILNGCFEGLEIQLSKKITTLGRSIECDICLDDSLVSNEHAEIVSSDDGFILNDLNSRNGSTINGNEVHNHKLKNGDIIGIGNFRIRFQRG